MTMNIEFERGVLVDQDGFFAAAVQWQKGTPRPNVGGPRPAGGGALRIDGDPVEPTRLRLVTDPEAIADPVPNGRWDGKAKVWRKPSVQVWIVNVRRDDPRYGVLAGSRVVWPKRPMPTVQGWQRLVTIEPPKTRAGRKPLFDFEAGEWVVPVSVAILDDNGDVINVVVKPRLEVGDIEAGA
jgi:hypothetical protein